MAVLNSKLILSLVDKVTAPARNISQTVARLTDQQRRNSQQMSAMRGQMVGAAATAYGLGRAIAAPINAAVDFESAMADVKKVVDFETPDHFQKMGMDIVHLSTSLPMTAKGIAEIVAAAGQAGMKGGELMEFANLAAKVGVAFDMSAGETGEALAKIKTALRLSVSETSLLADAINHLSNTSASSAPDLIDYMKRVGAVGEQYGFAAKDTAVIGSAMIASGAEANVAATSFRNVGKALTRGASASKRQLKAYKTLGLSSKQVAKDMQKDATGTLRRVMGLIGKVPEHMQASLISDLFGDEARAIAPLVNNLKLYDDALASVSQQADFLGSSQKEYEARAATTGAALQKLKNQFTAVGIAIGEALLPTVNSTVQSIKPLLFAITDFVRVNPVLTGQIIKATAGLVALRIAATATRFAFFWLRGGYLSAAIAGLRGFGVAATFTIGRLKSLRNAMMAAQVASAIGGGGGFTSMLAGMAAPLAALKAAAAGVGALIMGITWPVWALVAAIAAVGLAVFNYWEPIKNFVSGFASVVSEEIGGAVSAISSFGSKVASAVGEWALEGLVNFGAMLGIDEASVRAAVNRAVSVVYTLKDRIVSIVTSIASSIGNWFSDIFTINDYSDQAEKEFRNAGERAARAMINAVKAIPGLIVDLFRGLGSKIAAAIGRVNWSAFVPSWVTKYLGGGSASGTPVAGARAAGGNVVGGSTYLVGEYGPELVTPSRSGYVHNAQDTADYLSDIGSRNSSSASVGTRGVGQGGQSSAQAPSVGGQAGAGNGTVSITNNMTFHGVEDIADLAEKVTPEIEKIINDALSGVQADTEWSVS